MTVSHTTPAERRRVIAATTIGTAIEWYDFFLYAAVAGLVFKQTMFAPLGAASATIAAFMTVGLSFLFRPLGAILAGYFADRFGRRAVLMVTLFAMGLATTLIGLMPTYATIGWLAPAILVMLRIIQGISAGGEWSSAVLMSVEHAPVDKRGLFGSGPQVGAPAGLLLSSAALALMNMIAPGDAFVEWGWRVPFLFSLVLMLLGWWIRTGVDESPVYAEMAQDRSHEAKNPLGTLFANHFPLVITAALAFAANSAVGYMTTGGYVQSYVTNPDGLAIPRGDILWAVTASAATWMISTAFAGWLSDYLGRTITLTIGFVVQFIGVAVLFPLVDTGEIAKIYGALIFLAVGIGLSYGQVAALYAEFFPASVRASGTAISYALGAILGGAFAPTIAARLYESTGGNRAITIYLLVMTTVGLFISIIMRERKGIPLGHEYEDIQSQGHFVWQPRPASL
ncbi:Inner membrane metabolite transport protein YhjE [Corynebacterium glaucum]|uniref:Inner membrane metabolite transport protein YhjE n=1 Tax=Corynebacterium glaucum TaxID=187491 RepID=A0A1Q2HVJ8_9CORY|nr:MFS transporter [Corynebacterium glaucum]AQQ14810.1 Inner membrane metabolite transport protein YhjE [Corynebacterium glaucum]